MKYITPLLALAATAFAMPQGVSSAIAPSSSPPAGCMTSVSGKFTITVVNVTQSKTKRQADGVLTLTLADGVLKDQAGRTGYIAANRQFQFDAPPQTGAIYTSGFSVCANKTLAIGGSAIFFQCLSGNFYNLYDKSQGNQCAEIYIYTQGATGGSSGAAPAATQVSDGQPQATSAQSVSQITDGQPQASTSAAKVSQISDGQPQASTGAPVTQISDGQPQASTAMPAPTVSQISDGQPQAPTSASGAPVTQISDGQPQASTGAPVTQISDGQPQASTGAPVTQISDGQPQASTGAPVTQISDGQPQAATSTYSPPAVYTGAAERRAPAGVLLAVAGAIALL